MRNFNGNVRDPPSSSWPSQEEDELPDCNLYSCNYEDDENYYTKDQEAIVNIYEVRGEKERMNKK